MSSSTPSDTAPAESSNHHKRDTEAVADSTTTHETTTPPAKKNKKEEYLKFHGRREPRVGDDFQAILPSAEKLEEKKESEEVAKIEQESE